MSFLDPSCYHKQFTDMLAAGVDFVLPDYWGEPGQYARRVAPAPELNLFATQGLPPMVAAPLSRCAFVKYRRKPTRLRASFVSRSVSSALPSAPELATGYGVRSPRRYPRW
jgi:hypothetical protein